VQNPELKLLSHKKKKKKKEGGMDGSIKEG
jgi:hypothetical protein